MGAPVSGSTSPINVEPQIPHSAMLESCRAFGSLRLLSGVASFSQICLHNSGRIAGTAMRSTHLPSNFRFPTMRAEVRMYFSLSLLHLVTPVVVLTPLLVQSRQIA